MSEISPRLALPYIQPSQAQKHLTHNEALRLLDGLVQLSVEGLETAPPAAPEPGASYIVAPGATGGWAGQDGAVALWDGAGWQVVAPQEGWRAWRRDVSELWISDGTGWAPFTGFADSVPQLGINAMPDAASRLAVSAPASLFSHEGGGHQIKVNKSDITDTASLLFQTGWSGRAEMGTAGTDDFAIKVSADGAAWATALSVATQTGVPDLAAGTTIGGQEVYARGNLLGAVSETGGQPAGAVIDRGSTANGDYVRFADGTQICTGDLDTSATAGVVWSYPVPFAVPPHVTGSIAVTAAQFLTTSGPGSTTEITVNGWSHSGSRVASPARVLATGRWF